MTDAGLKKSQRCLSLRWSDGGVGFLWLFLWLFFVLFPGIRDVALARWRCPCAGRHLLFFAAAKKSRQKKAAHTANTCLNQQTSTAPAY